MTTLRDIPLPRPNAVDTIVDFLITGRMIEASADLRLFARAIQEIDNRLKALEAKK